MGELPDSGDSLVCLAVAAELLPSADASIGAAGKI